MSITRKRIAILIIVTLLAPILFSLIPGIGALTAKEVSAEAVKAKLYVSKIEVGVNASPQYIGIENYNNSAVYLYKSDNEKIATISEYGIVKGIKVGKTKITVTEKLDGVETKIGSIAVNVVRAYLDKEMKVGISTEANYASYISVYCRNYDATYTYKSSNTKVAKVNKSGCVIGIKYGTVTISVTQKLAGKTSKVGTIKVNIVKSFLEDKELKVPVSDYALYGVYISCRNDKATYKYKSQDPNIAKVDEYGNVTGVKIGETKIDVTETYQKKTVKLGAVTIKVVGAAISKDSNSVNMSLKSTYTLTDLIQINYYNNKAYYYATSDNSNIVSVNEINEYGYIYCSISALALGETKLTIYEKSNQKTEKIGTVTVTVKEYPIQKFDFFEGALDMVAGVPTKTFEPGNDEAWYNMKDYINIDPYYTTTPITFTSSDNSIIKIDDKGNITTVGAGSATLTATCGKYSISMNAIVPSLPVTSFKFDDNNLEYSETVNQYIGIFYLGMDYSYFSFNEILIKKPYNTTDKVKFTSSDESIIKVDSNGIITLGKKGTAIITATCGKLSDSLTVKVEAE